MFANSLIYFEPLRVTVSFPDASACPPAFVARHVYVPASAGTARFMTKVQQPSLCVIWKSEWRLVALNLRQKFDPSLQCRSISSFAKLSEITNAA